VASIATPTDAPRERHEERDICDPSDRWEENELTQYAMQRMRFARVSEIGPGMPDNYIVVISWAFQLGEWCSRRAASAIEPLIEG
jgi:hypothetical protein